MGDKRAMARGARAMAMATKMMMANNGNNKGNGFSKEGDRPLMVAMIGMVQTRALMLQLERGGDGGDGPWFVCVFW